MWKEKMQARVQWRVPEIPVMRFEVEEKTKNARQTTNVVRIPVKRSCKVHGTLTLEEGHSRELKLDDVVIAEECRPSWNRNQQICPSFTPAFTNQTVRQTGWQKKKDYDSLLTIAT